MNKRDFLLRALHANCASKRHWINSVFSLVVNPPVTSVPYALFQVDGKYAFTDPETNTQVVIADSDATKPLFRLLEPFQLNPGDLINHKGPGSIVTTPGNVLVNYLCLVRPFGDVFPFVEGFFNVKAIERQIVKIWLDDPDDDIDGNTPFEFLPKAPPGHVYVRQVLQFNQAAFFLKFLATNNVQSTSERSMSYHPDRDKVRDAFLADPANDMSDPAAVARLGNQLEELDRQWLSGDPAEQFYKSNDNKLFGVVRKKKWYLGGGESPFEDGTQVQFIKKSLEEGIDTDRMVVMNNSLRFGSYNRGNQTKLGGESTKTIYRMLGNAQIKEPDCGSRYGMPFVVTEHNQKGFIGFWQVLINGESRLIDETNIKPLVGKEIRMRSPMTCKTGRDVVNGLAGRGKHICERCAGEDLSKQPGGLGAAAAGTGGIFLSLFLSLMHGTTLKTTKWTFEEHLH